MTAFVDTVQHLAWVLAFIAVIAAVALLLDRTLGRPSIERHVSTALDLPGPDAIDAEFLAWVIEAERIGNSASFEAAVRADIEAIASGDVA